MTTETGHASIFIEVVDGNITVYHGSDGNNDIVLYTRQNAPKGSWDKLWDAIRAL